MLKNKQMWYWIGAIVIGIVLWNWYKKGMVKVPSIAKSGSNGGDTIMPVGDAIPLAGSTNEPGRSISGLQTFAPESGSRLSVSGGSVLGFKDTGDYCRTADGQHGTIDRWGNCQPQVKAGYIF